MAYWFNVTTGAVEDDLNKSPVDRLMGPFDTYAAAAASIAPAAMRPAIRIRSTVSASLTSEPVNFAGAGRSTYSGRGMAAGTPRRPLRAPGATLA